MTLLQKLFCGFGRENETTEEYQMDHNNDNRNTNNPGTLPQEAEEQEHAKTDTKITSATTNHPSCISKYAGILFALSASIYFSLTFLDVKILQTRGFPPFGTAVLFNLGVTIPCLIIIVAHEIFVVYGPSSSSRTQRKMILDEIWPLTDIKKRTVFGILILQGTLQSLSVVFRAYSLKYLAIADMTVIVFSSPILTTIIAHFVVHEPCGPIFIVIALYTFSGVILITKPPLLVGGESFDSNQLIGIGFATGALLCLSMKFVVTRKIHNANVFLMTLFLGSTGILFSLPLFLIFEDWNTIIPKNTTECFLVLGLLGAFAAIFSINSALKRDEAGPIALVRTLDVIFAFLLQFLFLNVVPDFLSLVGALIVVSGVLAVGLRKWLVSTKFGQERCTFC